MTRVAVDDSGVPIRLGIGLAGPVLIYIVFDQYCRRKRASDVGFVDVGATDRRRIIAFYFQEIAMANTPPRLLLFDLGGVLVDYDPIGPLTRLLPERDDHSDIVNRWGDREALRRLETGQCAPHEFAAAVIAEFGLRLSHEEFLADFVLWDRGPLPGAVELLRALRGKVRLACLSNNNSVHWGRLCDVFGIHREFDAAYLSHEIGVMKPDRRAYEYVLARERVAPSDTVFFDDNADNVAAAGALGIAAYRCIGIDAVRRRLAALNLGALAGESGGKPT
jgi:putative hydrolase of the HAD superfamily